MTAATVTFGFQLRSIDRNPQKSTGFYRRAGPSCEAAHVAAQGFLRKLTAVKDGATLYAKSGINV
jgi:hypothetical protein